MSGNLGGFRSSGLSTAARAYCASVTNSAGFEALLTFPGIGLSKWAGAQAKAATRGHR